MLVKLLRDQKIKNYFIETFVTTEPPLKTTLSIIGFFGLFPTQDCIK